MKIGLYSRLSVISTFIFCASLACQSIIPLEPERPHSEDSGSYSFDEATIFRSLAQGNSIEFTLILENWIVPTPTSNHNQRSFKDFFDLAQAFHQWKWKETMMSWNLFELQYQVNCTTVDRGPSFIGMKIFKIGHPDDKDIRFVRTIQVGHPDGTIFWTEAERYPVNENWPFFDSTNIDPIVAKNALKVGEENGGQRARLAVENDCVIYIMFAPYLSTNDWGVRYFQRSSSSAEQRYLFELYVDKTSGEFRIIQP